MRWLRRLDVAAGRHRGSRVIGLQARLWPYDHRWHISIDLVWWWVVIGQRERWLWGDQ